MIRRVVFFQPRTLAATNYQTSVGGEQQWPPWFALALAPVVRRAGLSVSLVDARVNPGWTDRIEELSPSDMLAVSVMTGHAIRDALRASEIARAVGAKVIWGGPHVTLFPQETAAQAPIDGVVSGFGYTPLASLLAGAAERDRPSDPFVYHPSPSALTPPDNEFLPYPDLGLIRDWTPYLNTDVAIAPRTVSLISSEGCTRKCTYCSEPATSQSRWLTRSIPQVVQCGLDLCQRSGANGVKLHDPNFFHDMPRAREFAELFSATLAFPWAATMHPADLAVASEAQLDHLAHHGLVRLLVGLESPDPRIVRLAGKQYDPTTIPLLAAKLAAAGIRGMFTFIVGWPDAPDQHYDDTIACAFRIRSIWDEHQAKIHFLEPWPGTPIYTLLARRGLRFPRTLMEWSDIDYYQAQHAAIHDLDRVAQITQANGRLSPYVDA